MKMGFIFQEQIKNIRISSVAWCWADGYLILVIPSWQKQRSRLQLESNQWPWGLLKQ